MELIRVLESLLFATDRPLTSKAISQIIHETAKFSEGTPVLAAASADQVEAALQKLQTTLLDSGSSLMVIAVSGGYLLKTRPDFAPWVNRLFEQPKAPRLSQPALETLAIIAYRQPISRAEVEKVRGVAVDGVLATLLERKLLKLAGRSDLPGKPLLYETTPLFLELFGLKSLHELPNAAELRRLSPPPQPHESEPELTQPEFSQPDFQPGLTPPELQPQQPSEPESPGSADIPAGSGSD